MEMEIEGLSDDDINSVPDISGLNFDHLNLSSRQPVRSAVTINEHLPQDMPTLDDILHLPQSSGEPISLANPGLPLLSLFGSRMENGQPHELSQHLNLQACNRSGISSCLSGVLQIPLQSILQTWKAPMVGAQIAAHSRQIEPVGSVQEVWDSSCMSSCAKPIWRRPSGCSVICPA